MLTINDPVTAANELRPVLLRLNRQLRRELGPVGITGGQAALLHAIRTSPGIGVRGLAEREGVSAPAMSGYVDRLEKAGLLTRVRSEQDRRRVGLDVTEQGAEGAPLRALAPHGLARVAPEAARRRRARAGRGRAPGSP